MKSLQQLKLQKRHRSFLQTFKEAQQDSQPFQHLQPPRPLKPWHQKMRSPTGPNPKGRGGKGRGLGSGKMHDFLNPLPQQHLSPLGDRLSQFYHQWQEIAFDQWVRNIIKTGHCLAFKKKTVDFPPRPSSHSKEHLLLVQREVGSLLSQVIERGPPSEEGRGIYSNFLWHPEKALRRVTSHVRQSQAAYSPEDSPSGTKQ